MICSELFLRNDEECDGQQCWQNVLMWTNFCLPPTFPWVSYLSACLKNMKMPFTKPSFFAHHYRFDNKIDKCDLKRNSACLCANCLFLKPDNLKISQRFQSNRSSSPSLQRAQPSPLPLKTLPNQMHLPAETAGGQKLSWNDLVVLGTYGWKLAYQLCLKNNGCCQNMSGMNHECMPCILLDRLCVFSTSEFERWFRHENK